jgi:hypothetical protein
MIAELERAGLSTEKAVFQLQTMERTKRPVVSKVRGDEKRAVQFGCWPTFRMRMPLSMGLSRRSGRRHRRL